MRGLPRRGARTAQGGPAMAPPDAPAASSPSPSGSARTGSGRTFPGFDPDLPLAPSVNNMGSAFPPASAGPSARRGPVSRAGPGAHAERCRHGGLGGCGTPADAHACAPALPGRPLPHSIAREPGTLLWRRCDARRRQRAACTLSAAAQARRTMAPRRRRTRRARVRRARRARSRPTRAPTRRASLPARPLRRPPARRRRLRRGT